MPRGQHPAPQPRLALSLKAPGGGADLVWASASYALQAGQEIEKLYALSPGGTAAVNLTGNEITNTLAGTVGANVLDGGAGADVMIGLEGDDIYYVVRVLRLRCQILEGAVPKDA